ncbi:MAG TPA: RodZ domain-containing protein [Acidobacteriota bacterium]|jgi:cytoskeletal protein RodZ
MQTVGSWLRSARAERDLSLDQISQATKINLLFLRSLEEDRFDRLPGGMFPRAMVRSYARALHANAEEAVNIYERQFPPPPPPPEPPPRNWNWLFRAAAILLITAAATGFLYLRAGWLNRSRQNNAAAIQLPASPKALIRSMPSTAPEPKQSVPLIKTVNKPSESVNLMLQIVVLDECWLSLSADGSVIDRRLLKKGEAYNYSANKNFEAVVGNAAGLKFVINGEVWENLGKSYSVKRIRIDKDEGRVHITT